MAISRSKRLALLYKQHHTLCQVSCVVAIYYLQQLNLLIQEGYVDKPIRDTNEYKYRMRREILNKLTSSDQICHNILRMRVQAFMNLCEMLKCTSRVRATINTSIEEKVAIFCYLVAHSVKYRELCLFFHRGSRSISKYIHEVVKGILSLHEKFIKQPDGLDVPPQILNNERFYPYFKDCLGAIDCTHIRVKVSASEAPKYRGRKDWPTTNVLAACSFDMKFTYVLAGWEGTASDSRIIKNAISRADPLKIPNGKYYLGDAGFGLTSWLMTPYRGVRYHLKEYSKHAPENARELYNHRHASARNVIERCFGVLKKRFPIIASGNEPHFNLCTHVKIILSCCILHNYLMGVDPPNELLAQVDEELLSHSNRDVCRIERQDEEFRKGSLIRDAMINELWNDYLL